MKKLRIFVLMLVVILAFSGCHCASSHSNGSEELQNTYTTEPDDSHESIFHNVRYINNDGYFTRILLDSETKVMYLWYDEGLSVMLNSDGTPKLYDESSTEYAQVKDIRDVWNPKILIDSETGVMYLMYEGGMSVMLKEDGMPKLYDESTSIYNHIELEIREAWIPRIVVDSESKVMYIVHNEGMSNMLNADGTPKLYDRDTSIYSSTWSLSDAITLVDWETNVIYRWYRNGEGAGIAFMFNADGLPKLYDEGSTGWSISDSRILIDSETDVMYIWFQEGMSWMLNADGTPKLYKQQ